MEQKRVSHLQRVAGRGVDERLSRDGAGGGVLDRRFGARGEAVAAVLQRIAVAADGLLVVVGAGRGGGVVVGVCSAEAARNGRLIRGALAGAQVDGVAVVGVPAALPEVGLPVVLAVGVDLRVGGQLAACVAGGGGGVAGAARGRRDGEAAGGGGAGAGYLRGSNVSTSQVGSLSCSCHKQPSISPNGSRRMLVSCSTPRQQKFSV